VDIYERHEPARRGDDFRMEIDLNANDFHTEWKRCNMVANYLADYTAYEYKRRELAENLFSTIINELLEAIARLAAFRSVIRFSLCQDKEGLMIDVNHECQENLVGVYRDFVTSINQTDDRDLYLDLLTGETIPSPSFNQLGLAMIVHDFGGTIALEQRGGSPFMTTHVHIPTREFAS
jgi:hypothetical protein